jgi:hypothetical protein
MPRDHTSRISTIMPMRLIILYELGTVFWYAVKKKKYH